MTVMPMADTMAKLVRPMPHKIPMAETKQMVAAVVRPRTCAPEYFTMIPAPKNPTPTTILAMTVKNPLFLAIISGRFSGEVAIMLRAKKKKRRNQEEDSRAGRHHHIGFKDPPLPQPLPSQNR